MVSDDRKLNPVERRLYRRHIALEQVGEAGQQRLLTSRVLVIGLGGLGSAAAYYLAAAGIGVIGIADSDRVELSNLQRQILHDRNDVGKMKTFSAQEKLMALRPDLQLLIHTLRVTRENAVAIVRRYDFVIEATDNFHSKFLVNDACMQAGKAFSHAGIAEFCGQTMTVVPGEGPCLRCIFEGPPPPEAGVDDHETGVLGTVAGVVGTIQATEAIKYLLGHGTLLVGRLLTWDALAMTFREIQLPAERRCSTCEEAHRS